MYQKGDQIVDAVQVEAPDWNGQEFDGCPFSAVPKWLDANYRVGRLIPVTPNSTDYAEWRVDTEDGPKIATPGDWIVNLYDRLTVVTDEDFKVEYRLLPE